MPNLADRMLNLLTGEHLEKGQEIVHSHGPKTIGKTPGGKPIQAIYKPGHYDVEPEEVEKSEDYEDADGGEEEIEKGHNNIVGNYENLDIYKSASEPQKRKVKKVMDEWKSGKLKSGSGDKVTDQNQAIAIAMSEAGLSNKTKKAQYGAHKEVEPEEEFLEDDQTENYNRTSIRKSQGEGARGGNIIGHTRSGKPIYNNFNHSSHKNYTSVDHGDAAAHHYDIRANRHETSTKEAMHHENQEDKHLEAAKKKRHLDLRDKKVEKAFEDLLGDDLSVNERPKRKIVYTQSNRVEKAIGDLLGDVLEKAEFNTAERRKLAKEHEAMPDGSFPIRNRKDLENAVKRAHSATNPEAAKRWIRKRAKELHCEDCLPEDWGHKEHMEKALGEGSKGGNVIGHTKSGKAIYDRAGHPKHKDFVSEDHNDAIAIHRQKAAELHRLAGNNSNSEERNAQMQQYREHKRIMDRHDIERKKKKENEIKKMAMTPAITKSHEIGLDNLQNAQMNRITNIQKSFVDSTQEQANQSQFFGEKLYSLEGLIKSNQFMIVTESGMSRYIDDLEKSVGNGLMTEEQATRGHAQLRRMKLIRVIDPQGQIGNVYVLEKAVGGEGARGGNIIGHTSTGKPIYSHFHHPEHKNFTSVEHKEAANIHHEKHDFHREKSYGRHDSQEHRSLAEIHENEGFRHNAAVLKSGKHVEKAEGGHVGLYKSEKRKRHEEAEEEPARRSAKKKVRKAEDAAAGVTY